MPIADKSIMRAAIITDKDQVMKDMEEQTQAQSQMQQQQAQMQAQKDASEIEKQKADTILKFTQAQKNKADVEEKHASAEHQRTQADLDLIKMMVELEDMQFSQIRTAFDHAQAIKMANQQQNQPMGVI